MELAIEGAINILPPQETADASKLLKDFIEIRKKAEKAPIGEPVPINLSNLSSGERARMFDAAYQTWLHVFDKGGFNTTLSNFNPQEENQDILKTERKQGLILSSTFIYFDARHQIPPHHYRLIKKIGKLNDPLLPDTLERHKTDALNEISIYEPAFELRFQPETDENYQIFIKNQLNTLKDEFQKTAMPAKEFHEARKAFRHIMNFLQIESILHPDSNYFDPYKNWYHINQKLGTIHDSIILNAGGDRESYSSSEISVPEDVRSLISQHIDAIT